MANIPDNLSRMALPVYQTLSVIDLVSKPSSIQRSSVISTTASFRGRWEPIPADPIIDPRANLEATYPLLHKFVNNQLEWDAPLQLLKLTLQIINDKSVFRKKTDATQFEDLKQLYRTWWTLIRSNPSCLQTNNVRKLSKFVKDFIVAALEDASYAVKVAVLGSEKAARLSVRERESGVVSLKGENEKKSAQRLSSQFSHILPGSRVSPTSSSARTSSHPRPQSTISSAKLNLLDNKQIHRQKSKMVVHPSQPQIQATPDVPADLFATTIKSIANEDEVYMQIIVKDILSDISAREAERQKKLQQASDEAARGHRSSATTGEHTRIPFGSKRMSGKTIKSRIPLHSIKTSKIVGSAVDSKHGGQYATGVGMKSLLEASHLRNELRGKMESIKLRNDTQDISPADGVKSMKEKVHLKLRANGASQAHSYVRPLGKK